MTTETEAAADENLSTALDTARLTLAVAQKRAALWSQELVSDEDAAVLLGLPYSTWHSVRQQYRIPMVRLGRRLSVRTATLRAWIEDREREQSRESA